MWLIQNKALLKAVLSLNEPEYAKIIHKGFGFCERFFFVNFLVKRFCGSK